MSDGDVLVTVPCGRHGPHSEAVKVEWWITVTHRDYERRKANGTLSRTSWECKACDNEASAEIAELQEKL